VPWTEESRCGKKTGLFCGRIDQDVPVADSHGVIRILWKNPDVVRVMEQKIVDGEWRMPTGLKAKRQSKKVVASAQPAGAQKNAQAICKVGQEASVSLDIGEAFTASKNDAIALSTKVSVAEMKEVFGSDSDSDGERSVGTRNGSVEAEELANMALEDTDAGGADHAIKSRNAPAAKVPEDVDPSPSNEEEVSCEEREHNGTVYLVEPSSNTIYNEMGEKLGTWTEDGPKLRIG